MYRPHQIGDDPYRVAPPGCAPGEVEPPERPAISEEEAVKAIIAAIWSGEPAYGVPASELLDDLLDQIVGGSPAEIKALVEACMPLKRVRTRCLGIANGDLS